MTGLCHRRLCVGIAAAVAAFGVWKYAPGTWLDRSGFMTVVDGVANPPFFVSGSGGHVSPWQLRTFSSNSKPDKRQAPVIVSLGDDVDGIFQSSPLAPVDFAVVLRNFQRLGANKAATAAVLAWEVPDPSGLLALEKCLDRFESLVMAAPLSRGAVSSIMPPSFRRASVPLAAIHGDVNALPIVNRIALPGVVLGGEAMLAGFSVLESEDSSRYAPLLAQWGDRVVFSFSLLTVLQRLNLSISGVEVRLGESLKLSADGPIVRIDKYGRLAAPLQPLAAYAEISAEDLIDGGEDLFPKQAPDPVILRDDRTAAETATREFSRMLSSTIAALACDDGLSRLHPYPRLRLGWEISILLAYIILLTVICGASSFVRGLGFIALVGVCLSAQWIAVGMVSVWLPGLAILSAIAAAVIAGNFSVWYQSRRRLDQQA